MSKTAQRKRAFKQQGERDAAKGLPQQLDRRHPFVGAYRSGFLPKRFSMAHPEVMDTREGT